MSAITVSHGTAFANIIVYSVMKGSAYDVPDTGRFCVFRYSRIRSDLLKRLATFRVLVADNGLIDDRMDEPSIKSYLGLLWLIRSMDRAGHDSLLTDRVNDPSSA